MGRRTTLVQNESPYHGPYSSRSYRMQGIHDAFGNQVADQHSLIAFVRRQIDYLRVRRIGFKFICGIQRHGNNAYCASFFLNIPFGLSNVQFRKLPVGR